MFKWFSSPYPFLFTFKRNIIIASVFGLLSFVLNALRLSETFASQHFLYPKYWVSIGFGIVVFLSIIFVFQIIPQLFIKPSKKNNWIAADEIKLILLLFLVMIIFIYIYFVGISYTPKFFFSQTFITKLLLYFFSASIPFSFLVVWVNYTILLKQNLAKVKEHNHLLQKIVKQVENKTQDKIIIPSNTKKETIEFNVNDLLFIKSEGNYITIYEKTDDTASHSLFRASLHDVLQHLIAFPQIIQVHRSYIVNIRNISHTQGNARNYQLFFENYDGSVPVSRNKFKEFNQNLEAIS